MKRNLLFLFGALLVAGTTLVVACTKDPIPTAVKSTNQSRGEVTDRTDTMLCNNRRTVTLRDLAAPGTPFSGSWVQELDRVLQGCFPAVYCPNVIADGQITFGNDFNNDLNVYQILSTGNFPIPNGQFTPAMQDYIVKYCLDYAVARLDDCGPLATPVITAIDFQWSLSNPNQLVLVCQWACCGPAFEPCNNRKTVTLRDLAAPGTPFSGPWIQELDRVLLECFPPVYCPNSIGGGQVTFGNGSNNDLDVYQILSTGNFPIPNGQFTPAMQDYIVQYCLNYAAAHLDPCSQNATPTITEIDFQWSLTHPNRLVIVCKWTCCGEDKNEE